MKKEDFRVKRTKHSIKNAFLNLMKNKAYAKISIKEITEVAIVNRNTFYLHYLDKDDLLDKLLNESLSKMISSMESKESTRLAELTYSEFSKLVQNQFTVVEEDLEFFQLIFEDESIPYLQTKFSNVVKHHMSGGEQFDSLSKKRQAYITFLSSGLTGLMKFWLKNKEHYSSEEMTAIVIDIYAEDVLEVLKKL
jgi:AcrR family transcriptional regulator